MATLSTLDYNLTSKIPIIIQQVNCYNMLWQANWLRLIVNIMTSLMQFCELKNGTLIKLDFNKTFYKMFVLKANELHAAPDRGLTNQLRPTSFPKNLCKSNRWSGLFSQKCCRQELKIKFWKLGNTISSYLHFYTWPWTCLKLILHNPMSGMDLR